MHLLMFGRAGFSAILTNPPIRAGKKTVFSFYEGAFSKLRAGGELWVVIQKKQGAPSTIASSRKAFWECRDYREEKRLSYY